MDKRRTHCPVLLLVLLPAVVVGVGACCKNKPPAAQAGAASAELTRQDPSAPPPRPTTKAACDACKGSWARHGLAETETCVCRTKDGGKVCRDGVECEGQCIAADDGGFEVKEPGPPPKGYWVGKCSEMDTTFGCHRTIPHGASKKPPQVAEDAADTMCID